jgi:Tol biopolymer transport system component
LTFTNQGSGVFYPFWSPDGARLAYNRTDEPPSVIELGVPWGEQTPRLLPRPPDPNHIFWASSWSPDGRRLGGWVGPADTVSGLYLYDVERDAYERVTDFGSQPRWLADNRHLLFIHKGEIFLADAETGRVQRILSPAPHRVFGHGISKDNRTIYYGLATTDADVWLSELE